MMNGRNAKKAVPCSAGISHYQEEERDEEEEAPHKASSKPKISRYVAAGGH